MHIMHSKYPAVTTVSGGLSSSLTLRKKIVSSQDTDLPINVRNNYSSVVFFLLLLTARPRHHDANWDPKPPQAALVLVKKRSLFLSNAVKLPVHLNVLQNLQSWHKMVTSLRTELHILSKSLAKKETEMSPRYKLRRKGLC